MIEKGKGGSHRERMGRESSRGEGRDSSREEGEEEYCRGEGDGVIERGGGGGGSYRKVD